MSWYALDALDDALDETRAFLLPLERGRWLRLAVVATFVGGSVVAFLLAQFVTLSPPATTLTEANAPTGDGSGLDPLTLVQYGAAFVVALAFLLGGPVLRFVFLDGLRTGELRLRGPFRDRFVQGFQLMTLPLAGGLLITSAGTALFLALVTGGPALVDLLPSSAGSVAGQAVLFVGLVVGVVVGFCLFGFFHVSTAFVAPVMVATDSGIVSAWARVARLLQANLDQTVAYVAGRVVLGSVVWLAATTALSLVGFLLALVAIVTEGQVSSLLSDGGTTLLPPDAGGLVVAGAVGLTGVVVLLVVIPVRIVLLTFYTTYELSVLGLLHREFDLLDVAESPEPTGASRSVAQTETTDPDEFGGFVFGVTQESETATPSDDETHDGTTQSNPSNPSNPQTANGEPAASAASAASAGDDDPAGSADASIDDETDGPADDDWSRPYWRS